eukprot:COSAG06_NODE_57353_length_280_cov_1.325967_1_plen_26_part_10
MRRAAQLTAESDCADLPTGRGSQGRP